MCPPPKIIPEKVWISPRYSLNIMVYNGVSGTGTLSLGLTVSITKFSGLQSKSCINIQNKSGVSPLIHMPFLWQPEVGNLWGMCGEPRKRFPTLQSLYTSAFQAICGEWGAQQYFDNNRLGVSPLIHIFSSNYLEVTIIFPIFATDSGSPQGRTSQSLVEKGRLQTLSSTCRSRKSKLRRERNRNVHIGCIVPYSLI